MTLTRSRLESRFRVTCWDHPRSTNIPSRSTAMLAPILFAVVLAGCGALGSDDEGQSSASSSPTSAPEPATRVVAAQTPESTLRTSFGDGSYEVGVDISPGTYRTSGPRAGMPICSYARLRTAGASYADTSQVLQLENVMGPAVVTIQPSDGGFFSQLCDEWVEQTANARQTVSPQTSFGDGSYEVGVDIAPGTYRTAGPAAGMPICSYARLRTAGASYTDASQVLQLENVMGPAVVTIQPSDGGFFSQLCETWTQR